MSLVTTLNTLDQVYFIFAFAVNSWSVSNLDSRVRYDILYLVWIYLPLSGPPIPLKEEDGEIYFCYWWGS